MYYSLYIVCGDVFFCLQELQKQTGLLLKTEQEITLLQKEMVSLECDIASWETDDFYKEKVAREQLQMARKGDILFYIGE